MESEHLVGLAEINAAAKRIAGLVRRTPIVPTSLGTTSSPLLLKAENLQVTGSFKARGAGNAVALLDAEARARGVVTHSSGNHAQALARAAREAGIQATVVMPRQTPDVKRLATLRHGARVELVELSERASRVEEIVAETGAVFVSPFDNADIIAGQGTVGLEIVEDVPELTSVWVPVSGGGLISGIAAAIKALAPQVRVIGVEPELAGDLAEGFASGHRVTWEAARTGSDHRRRASRPGGRGAELGAHHGVRRRGRDGERGRDQVRPAPGGARLQARLRAQRSGERGRLPRAPRRRRPRTRRSGGLGWQHRAACPGRAARGRVRGARERRE